MPGAAPAERPARSRRPTGIIGRVRAAHLVVGLFIVGAFGLMWLWGLGTWISRRGPGRAFWWLVAAVQVGVLLQLAGGVVLLLVGGRRGWLHYVYGIGVPAFTLMWAHVVARGRFAARPWLAFAVAGFFAFFSSLRALQTGLGIG